MARAWLAKATASGDAVEPEQRERGSGHREHRGDRREDRGDLGALLPEHELRREVLVHGAQVLLVRGVVVLAAGVVGSESSKIASSDASMPRPIAVARCGRRRLIAATTRSLSFVGACTTCASPEKATTPSFTSAPCRSTNAFAASFAASMRFGFRSSASMLPDTSSARMTVPSCTGTTTVVWGRAVPSAMKKSAIRKSAGGM